MRRQKISKIVREYASERGRASFIAVHGRSFGGCRHGTTTGPVCGVDARLQYRHAVVRRHFEKVDAVFAVNGAYFVALETADKCKTFAVAGLGLVG